MRARSAASGIAIGGPPAAAAGTCKARLETRTGNVPDAARRCSPGTAYAWTVVCRSSTTHSTRPSDQRPIGLRAARYRDVHRARRLPGAVRQAVAVHLADPGVRHQHGRAIRPQPGGAGPRTQCDVPLRQTLAPGRRVSARHRHPVGARRDAVLGRHGPRDGQASASPTPASAWGDAWRRCCRRQRPRTHSAPGSRAASGRPHRPAASTGTDGAATRSPRCCALSQAAGRPR